MSELEHTQQRLSAFIRERDQLKKELAAANQRAEKDAQGAIDSAEAMLADRDKLRADKERAERALADAEKVINLKQQVIERLQREKKEADAAAREMSDKLDYVLTSTDPGSLPYWQHKHDELLGKWFKAEAALAETQHCLAVVADDGRLTESDEWQHRASHALSSTCGKGWVSPEQLGPTIELLRWIEDGLNKNSLDAIPVRDELARLQKLTEGK